jgi:hypothetical protein
VHKKNKLASNGYKSMREESAIHQDDEIRYVFTPTKQSYNGNMKNILLWTSFGEEEKA